MRKSHYKPTPTKPSINSLKSLIDKHRVPLSRYIREKAPIDHLAYEEGNYFEKLKRRLGDYQRNHEEINRIDTEQMDIELSIDKSISKNQHKFDVDLTKYLKKTIQTRQNRSKSIQARPLTSIAQTPPTYKTNTLLPQNNQTTKKLTINENGQQEMNFNPPLPLKQMQNEVVNYRNLTSLIQGEIYQNQINIVQLREVVGCGAFGIVRKGVERNTGKLFAVKIYEKYKLGVKQKARVMKELQIMHKLSNGDQSQLHPNLVELCGAYSSNRQLHLLLPLLPALTLTHFRRAYLPNSIPINILKQILLQLASAVEYLHSKNITHRDIKEENVLVEGAGTTNVKVRLIDFGFAVEGPICKSVCGTPNYMPPELFKMKPASKSNPKIANHHQQFQPQSYPTDIWSLGVLFFHLLTSTFPFVGYSQQALKKTITAGTFTYPNPSKSKQQDLIRAVINKMLVRQAEERATAAQVRQMLQQI